MIPYQFADAVTIDLERLVAIDDILFINASVNKHSDWTYGEYYYDLVFQFTTPKVRRFAPDKKDIIAERNQLIEDWKNGRSKSLVPIGAAPS